MKFSISPRDCENLLLAVLVGLEKALKNPNQHEPQLIANMVWHLTREINQVEIQDSNITEILSSGVFIHSNPKVESKHFPEKTPKSVEIGDLLLLRTEKTKRKVISRRALLFQAKKCKGLPVKPGNKNQLYLYEKWPLFSYVRSSQLLNDKERKIKGLDVHNATKYLLLSNNSSLFCGCPCFFLPLCQKGVIPSLLTAFPVSPTLEHYRCLVLEIMEFIMGDAGKPFRYPPPSKNRNWDRVIEDLVDTTALAASVYIDRATGGMSTSRGLCFVSGVPPTLGSNLRLTENEWNILSGNTDSPPEASNGFENEEESGGGISIIEFLVTVPEG